MRLCAYCLSSRVQLTGTPRAVPNHFICLLVHEPGIEPTSLHWQVESLPLSHQGIPRPPEFYRARMNKPLSSRMSATQNERNLVILKTQDCLMREKFKFCIFQKKGNAHRAEKKRQNSWGPCSAVLQLLSRVQFFVTP